MKQVLFVCTGNTCRSPMAAALFDRWVKEEGLAAAASSAGLAAPEGATATSHAIDAMAEVGLDISAHRARNLTDALVSDADFIVCMTENHAQAIRRALPQFSHKVLVPPGGVPDPYGGELAEYRLCRDALLFYLPSLREKLL